MDRSYSNLKQSVEDLLYESEAHWEEYGVVSFMSLEETSRFEKVLSRAGIDYESYWYGSPVNIRLGLNAFKKS
mgnify:CR=1 FL=1|jgi:hypothetical protein